MSFQRARQPEQKSQRLKAILEAAGRLFEKNPISEVSMRQIADEAGLGKASLYSYFQTKEEVFLHLFGLEVEGWVEEFGRRIARLRKPNAEKVAKLITDLMMERSRYSRLLSILTTVLERNVSRDRLREFKTGLLEPLGKMTEHLNQSLPELGEAKVQKFLIEFHAVMAGLWPMTHPNEELIAAMDVPHLKFLHVEFEPTCRELLVKLLSS